MYKYRINHFLSCLPMGISIEKFKANLAATHQISQDVFHFDRFIKSDESSFIPKERLNIYAKEFAVSVDQLIGEVKERKKAK